ncbi:hypothetical protein [Adhaeribacter aquaticus]|uniref:hypothetical protein n=1 Tax=Adhaeribacter aquaticus TaxID=299567 RepID=UPI001FE08399|nr:hypothetical protein [Adhaeribacter aquaticus]
MNSYQFVAVVGIIMSVGANLILWFRDTPVQNFWALYVCWSILFVIGAIINYNSKPDDGHHHHHH